MGVRVSHSGWRGGSHTRIAEEGELGHGFGFPTIPNFASLGCGAGGGQFERVCIVRPAQDLVHIGLRIPRGWPGGGGGEEGLMG